MYAGHGNHHQSSWWRFPVFKTYKALSGIYQSELRYATPGSSRSSVTPRAMACPRKWAYSSAIVASA
jgi:hypothetical protein